MVGPVPETGQEGKQDTIYFVMFGLVYRYKSSNFAESWPIEMVGSVPETVQDGKQDTICGIMFDIVCQSKFSNFDESWLIELVGPLLEIDRIANKIQYLLQCLTVFVSLNLACPRQSHLYLSGKG